MAAYWTVPAGASRSRRQVQQYSDSAQRQQGFAVGGAEQQTAAAAGRDQSLADSQRPAAQSSRRRGRDLGDSDEGASPLNRQRGPAPGPQQDDGDTSPPAPQPLSPPQTAAGAAIPANHQRLYVGRDKADAATFQLRKAGGKVGGELTSNAAANLLIELGNANNDATAIATHYGVHRKSGCDLGAWFAIDSACCQRWKEFDDYMDYDTLHAKIFQVVEEEFWKLDPSLLYSIFEHKIDVAKEIIKVKGNMLGKQPHAAARKRTRLAIEAARGDLESSSDEESSSDDE